jgi:hypothetical protein
MKAIDTLKGIVSDLTSLLIGVVGLGVVAGIVFGGNVAFFNDVLDGLLGVVSVLGENGLVWILLDSILICLINK